MMARKSEGCSGGGFHEFPAEAAEDPELSLRLMCRARAIDIENATKSSVLLRFDGA